MQEITTRSNLTGRVMLYPKCTASSISQSHIVTTSQLPSKSTSTTDDKSRLSASAGTCCQLVSSFLPSPCLASQLSAGRCPARFPTNSYLALESPCFGELPPKVQNYVSSPCAQIETLLPAVNEAGESSERSPFCVLSRVSLQKLLWSVWLIV